MITIKNKLQLQKMSSKDDKKESSEKDRKFRRKLKRDAEMSTPAPVEKKVKTSKVEVKPKVEIKTKSVVSRTLTTRPKFFSLPASQFDFVAHFSQKRNL